jgi:hypothetical protein
MFQEANPQCLETHLKRGLFVGSPVGELSRGGWEAINSYAERIGGKRKSNFAFLGYSGTSTFFTPASTPCAAKIDFPHIVRGKLGELFESYELKKLGYKLCDLWNEGRVVITDHTDFLLVNVYMPSLNPDQPDRRYLLTMIFLPIFRSSNTEKHLRIGIFIGFTSMLLQY